MKLATLRDGRPLDDALRAMFVEALSEELQSQVFVCDPWALPEVLASRACRPGG